MEHRKIRTVSIMTRKYQPGNAECIHKTALGLFKSGIIDKKQMKKFDDMCLEPEKVPDTKLIVRQLLKKEKVSEDYLSYVLSVPTNRLRKWASGEAQPKDPERKLLLVARRDGLKALA